jgi:hypothetical protein
LPFQDIIFAGLSSGDKRASGDQDGRRYRINRILAHQPQRHSTSRFRIHARQTGMIDERLFPDRLAA